MFTIDDLSFDLICLCNFYNDKIHSPSTSFTKLCLIQQIALFDSNNFLSNNTGKTVVIHGHSIDDGGVYISLLTKK